MPLRCMAGLLKCWAVADCCLLFYWLQSNVITGLPLPSLSCGPATLPTKINSSLTLGTHPVASTKSTPTVSIGIVATPGNSFTLFRPRQIVAAGNTSHLVIDHHWHKAIVNVSLLRSVQSSYCWCFSFIRSVHSHRCCFFLLSFVQSVARSSRGV
jgi:hypothetical protein